MKTKEDKILANNKKAFHDYFILETMEAGLKLKGTEVKSLRLGKCSLKESYVQIKNGEAYVYSMHISPYGNGNIFNTDPMRPKKLLLHKSEIRRLQDVAKQDGMTLVPTKAYLKGNYVKMEIGLAKGKKNYDKRESLKEKDAKRDMDRAMRVRI